MPDFHLLTGDRNIISQSGADEIIRNAQQYVQQFRYNQSMMNGSDETLLELVVKFDETAVNNMIRSYGLNLWGKERPAVLVWLAYDGSMGRRMMTFDETPELLQAVEKAAGDRGISLLFPLLDLEDTARLAISDVWAAFREPVTAASERYQSDAILIGRVTEASAGIWQGQWTMFIGQETSSWSTEADVGELVMEEGVNELADALADRYANIGASGAEVFQITVSNIRSNDDYARALSYLESIQSVTQVMVKSVKPNQVIFELISHGGVAALEQAIQLSRVLESGPAGEQQSYRLMEGY